MGPATFDFFALQEDEKVRPDETASGRRAKVRGTQRPTLCGPTLCLASLIALLRVGQLFQLLEMVAVPERDEDVVRFKDRLRVGIEEHLARALLDGHDDDAVIGADPGIDELLTGEQTAARDLRFLQLQIDVFGPRREFDEVHDGRTQDRVSDSAAADLIG